MRFIPLTNTDKEAMLAEIGASSIDELFGDIPTAAKLDRPLNIPGPLVENRLLGVMNNLANANKTAAPENIFLGAGSYPHYTPVAVDQLLLRSEVFTAYTPYQPEISQGTLMAIYEYQTFTAALMGMDIANASMYDGASALAEAVIMASRINKKRQRVVISENLNRNWLDVVTTYTQHLNIEIALGDSPDDKTCCLVKSYPNMLGEIENLSMARTNCDENGALLIVAVPEPVSLGLLKSPGEYGADIVVGEGNSFGGALNYGGPGLGMFSTRDKYARQMPGRLVGKTKDIDGKDGYVLTLATREQHIRREKATSNICSNQALCATAAAIHISLLGKQGLRDLAIRNHSSALYLKNKICELNGYEALNNKKFFNEVAIVTPHSPDAINKKLAENNIVGGFPLDRWLPDSKNVMLFCATEVHTKESIDRLTAALAEIGK